MPPRKSDASKAGATGDEGAGTPSKDKDKEGVNVEDLGLPRTMVQRLAKGVLPANTQIQKDAALALSKSATVFVSYLSSHANELAMAQNKKTIMPQNVLDAITELEFDDFLPRLEAELAKHTENQTDKRNNYRKKVAADRAAAPGDASSLKVTVNGSSGGGGGGDGGEEQDEEGAPPAAKKARRSTQGAADTNNSSHAAADTDDQQGPSADDDTVSEEDTEPNAEDVDDESEDEEGEEGPDDEEEVIGGGLETQDAEPPDDEALDNGEDSD